MWAASFGEWHDLLENVVKLDIEPSDYYGTGRGIEPRFGMVFFAFRWKHADVPVREEGPDGMSPLGIETATWANGDALHRVRALDAFRGDPLEGTLTRGRAE
jgi:hypothetical protein